MIASASSGDPVMKKRREDTPLDRVLRALNHPIRRRILRVLVDGTGSASTISKELKMNLGVVSYHLNQVLAKECDVVELVESLPRRGAIEKFYRLKFQAAPKRRGGRKGAESPSRMRRMSLEECFIVAAAATDSDSFEALDGAGWEWFLAQVDDEGWQEVREAGADFNRRVEAVVAEGQDAAGGGASREVVVGVAAFPAAPPPSAS